MANEREHAKRTIASIYKYFLENKGKEVILTEHYRKMIADYSIPFSEERLEFGQIQLRAYRESCSVLLDFIDLENPNETPILKQLANIGVFQVDDFFREVVESLEGNHSETG